MSNKKKNMNSIDEKSFTFCIEVGIFKKKLENFMVSTNKVNKTLVELLQSTSELIDNFTKSAEISEITKKNDTILKNTIEAFETKKIRVNSNLHCIACKKQQKFDDANLVEHVSLKSHQKACNKIQVSSESQQAKIIALPTIKENPKPDLTTHPIACDNTEIVPAQNSCEENKISPERQQPSAQFLSVFSPKKEKNENQSRVLQFPLNEDTKTVLQILNLDQYATGWVVSQYYYYANFAQIYLEIAGNINQYIKPNFPNAVPYIFGSSFLQLANKGSDLDIYIDLDCNFFKKLPRAEIIEVIKSIEECLLKSPDFSCVHAVTAARTPILKLLDNRHNILCDLSFGNGLSCNNSSLLLYYMELQPITRKLITFIKNWIALCKINVNGYSVSILVIFFLQVFSNLPSVERLQRNGGYLLFDEWNGGFKTLSIIDLKIQPVTHFQIALKNFFHYYGFAFDYDINIVCPFLGRPIKKTDFDLENIDKLPKEFDRFKAYMKSIDLSKADKVYDLFANDSAFVVQDPFELNHNVTKNFSEIKLAMFKDFCRQSYQIVSKRNRGSNLLFLN